MASPGKPLRGLVITANPHSYFDPRLKEETPCLTTSPSTQATSCPTSANAAQHTGTPSPPVGAATQQRPVKQTNDTPRTRLPLRHRHTHPHARRNTNRQPLDQPPRETVLGTTLREAHMAWSTSDRKDRLPDNWPQIRATVKARAKGKCEANPHAKGCGGWGRDADHKTPGDDHRLENLQWLSGPCHRAKTNQETAARNRERKAARIRPREQHPGRRA